MIIGTIHRTILNLRVVRTTNHHATVQENIFTMAKPGWYFPATLAGISG